MHRYLCGGYEIKREHDAVQYGNLMGLKVYRETRRPDQDPVLGHGIARYEGGAWVHVGTLTGPRPVAVDCDNREQPPVCAADCRYRQSFSDFKSQANALRVELVHLIATDRCGWNIKPGRLGGHALDYEPCIATQ